jgi:mannose-6-phosphate isomerase
MLVVDGALKEYAWGRIDGLSTWTKQRTGTPQAELWFGVHPSGPSPVRTEEGSGGVLLDHLSVTQAPILVKLLAAGQPLSIQVHPVADVAQRQWLAQQAGGDVVYADANEKTELLIALEPFEAFAGWRDVDQAVRMLQALPGTDAAVAALEAGDRIAAIRALLAIGELAGVAHLPEAARSAGLPDEECAAYATVARLFPGDVGALLTPLLAYVALDAGQGIYVPAGVPHSYLQGLGLEVMTSSDNVVRLGLTNKPVFVEHALNALILERAPEILEPGDGPMVTPAGFAAAVLHQATTSVPAGQYRVILALDGRTSVTGDGLDRELPVGAAGVLTADEPAVEVSTTGRAAVVTASVA